MNSNRFLILLLVLSASLFDVYVSTPWQPGTGGKHLALKQQQQHQQHPLMSPTVSNMRRMTAASAAFPSRQKRSSSATVESIDLCGRWDDWCSQGTTNPVLQCCPGYSCKCSVWNSNCRCRSKIFSGK